MHTPEALSTDDPHGHTGLEFAHHFDDWQQEYQSKSLGMWLFLVTEVMFFGGMFLVYMVYRYQFTPAFDASSRLLNLWAGAINTVVLLASSFTVALAVHAAHLGNRKMLVRLLAATLLLGVVFLGIKAYE